MAFLSSFYPQPVVAGTTEGTFAEGDHTHELDELDASGIVVGKVLTANGLDAASWQDPAVASLDWDLITDKPAEFPPSSHNHAASAINSGTLDIARIPTGTTSSTVAIGNDSRITGALPAATAGTGSVLASGSNTARTLSDRFAERVNILDFGADPTGASSSRDALIAAIAAAPSGGVVYIPRGTYSGIHTIDIAKPITIFGDGQDATIIDLPNNGLYVMKLATGCSKFYLSDIKIQWEGGYNVNTNARSICVTTQGNNGIIDEIFVNRVTFRNLAECIRIWNPVIKNTVTNCRFLYKHGYAGCIFGSEPNEGAFANAAGAAGWPLSGNAKYTFLCYNFFDGLEDPTFTGVTNNPPDFVRTPIDNFYNGGGAPYDQIDISYNVILNFAIEGIILLRLPEYASFDDWYGDWPSAGQRNTGFTDFHARIIGNVLIGPKAKSHHYFGTNPAIAMVNPVNAIVSKNYISNCVVGIDLKKTFVPISCNASTDIFTADYSQFAVNPDYIKTTNGEAIQFVYKFPNGANEGGLGIELDKTYYVINASALSSNQRTFQLSEEIGGDPIDVTTNLAFGKAQNANVARKQNVVISDNHISNVLTGVSIFDGYEDGTFIDNNVIICSSEPTKSVQGWNVREIPNVQPPNYTDLMPVKILSSGATITNNLLSSSDPSWDGIFNVVSRSGTNGSVFQLESGNATIMNNLVQSTVADGPVLGRIVFWNQDQFWSAEVLNIDTDTDEVTTETSFLTGSGDITVEKIYWVKHNTLQDWSSVVCRQLGGRTARIYNNTFNNGAYDISINETPFIVKAANNTLISAKVGPQKSATIERIFDFGSIQFTQGTAAPSESASNGSIYLRRDSDASTTLYVRAGSAWKPLSSWNP